MNEDDLKKFVCYEHKEDMLLGLRKQGLLTPEQTFDAHKELSQKGKYSVIVVVPKSDVNLLNGEGPVDVGNVDPPPEFSAKVAALNHIATRTRPPKE